MIGYTGSRLGERREGGNIVGHTCSRVGERSNYGSVVLEMEMDDGRPSRKPQAVTHSLVLLKMGKIISRIMLS